MNADRDFTLRPSQQQKFRASDATGLISSVLTEILTGELYDAATAQTLSQKVAEEVRSRLKALHLEHYKYVVQVNLSEQRGQAAHIVAQCVWDSDCDAMAHSFFANDSLWCEAIVFAVFHY